MAKSMLNVGWNQLEAMMALQMRARRHRLKTVDERYTIQNCSCCGALPNSGRKVLPVLIREWTCSECGVTHDRDINAA